MFERFSIPKLIEIIGEDRLEAICGALELLRLEGRQGVEVYAKGFLSNFAAKTIGYNYINTSEGFETILQTLSLDEMMHASGLIGCNANKQDCVLKLRTLFRNKLRRREIFNSIGVQFSEQEYISKSRESQSTIKVDGSKSPYKPLKDYQFEVYFQALENLKVDHSRFILQMPTGSGKTRTAMEVITTYLNSYDEVSVIWLAHSSELCDQAWECFHQVWPHVATKDTISQKLYSSHKFIMGDNKKIDFLCASFQSIYALLKNDNSRTEPMLHRKRLIVVDEAHKAIAPTYKMVIKSLQYEGSQVMGLTATPGRKYTVFNAFNTDDENMELSKFFFETIVTYDPKNKNPIEYLREKGVLANAKSEVLVINSDIRLSIDETNRISEQFEIPSDILIKIGKSSIRNAEILAKLKKLVVSKVARSIIFFGTSVEHSIMISALLKFLDIASEHIDGTTPRSVREDIVSRFKNNEINVLCNYEVLSTGFDAPKVDCVFLARPTTSVVLYSQMIGRGLRGPAIGGTENCLIVNIKDNCINLPSINRMYKVFGDYWTTN